MKVFLVREEAAHPGKFVCREYRFLTGGDVVPIAPIISGTIEGARAVIPAHAKKIEKPKGDGKRPAGVPHVEGWMVL